MLWGVYGTTDGTAELLKKYAELNKRIKIINISNGGLSWVRNVGLNNACREYVRFIDADDRIPEDSMEIMVKSYFENDEVDLVIGNYLCEPQKNYFLGDIFTEDSIEAKVLWGIL